jgi:hypothetical protein
MDEMLQRIESRGHWVVKIYPTSPPKQQPRISKLFSIVDKAAVEIRSWDFPHIDRTATPHIDLNWVGQASEWEHALETWRLYQTGLFTDAAGFPEDWRDQSNFWAADEDWQPGTRIGIGEVIYRYSEIFLFAANLVDSPVGGLQASVEVELTGLSGRELHVDDPKRFGLSQRYVCSIDSFPYKVTAERSDLISKSWKFALEGARQLFERFGWDPGERVIESWQNDIPAKSRTQESGNADE